MDTLHSLMERTRECFGVHLCVHDVSGVTYARKSLSLPYLMLQHDCDYCTAVKRCVSEPRCMRQKQLVMWMLRRNGMKPFFGACHMGVCEYILPVCQSGRLLAVVFASGLTAEDEAESREKLERAFSLLSDGGKVDMDVCQLPWSPCAAIVIDRFGVRWFLSLPQHKPEDGWSPDNET